MKASILRSHFGHSFTLNLPTATGEVAEELSIVITPGDPLPACWKVKVTLLTDRREMVMEGALDVGAVLADGVEPDSVEAGWQLVCDGLRNCSFGNALIKEVFEFCQEAEVFPNGGFA